MFVGWLNSFRKSPHPQPTTPFQCWIRGAVSDHSSNSLKPTIRFTLTLCCGCCAEVRGEAGFWSSLPRSILSFLVQLCHFSREQPSTTLRTNVCPCDSAPPDGRLFAQPLSLVVPVKYEHFGFLMCGLASVKNTNGFCSSVIGPKLQ